MWPRPRQRRAGMYLAVLMTATIVAIIGLSALTAVRVQLRAAEGGNDVTVAGFCAQSAIEMGLLSISNDGNWRSTYTHDVWVPKQTLGGGTYTWKLVDEQNGSLLMDASAPVRLYGRGSVGDAVRAYSVLLKTDIADPTNLLSNPGFERGTGGWVGLTDCDLEISADKPHGGSACLWVKNRNNEYAGPRQDVADHITAGTTYETEVWVRMKDFSENIWFALWYRTEYGWSCDYFDVDPAGTSWTLVGGEFTASWSGTLATAYWKLETQWSGQEFFVDDAVVRKLGDRAPAALPVSGTWRRVVDAAAVD